MNQEASPGQTDGTAVDMLLDEADSSSLARRGFIKGGLGVAGFAAASAILAACGDDEEAPAPAPQDYALVGAIVGLLPADGRWSAKTREQWLAALTAVVDLEVAVSDG